ncbi:MAG: DUF2837 family protein [Chloroflexota bacterium]|nr:DUF2837 family protein [Chloroflexota bacterium]
MTNLYLGAVLTLTVLIYAVDISAYAARLAGVRTRRPTQAHSIYNLLALSSRAASALQVTLLAGLVDRAVAHGVTAQLTATLRLVLLAAAGGLVVGAAAVPSLARILARAVGSYERRQSLPRVLVHGLRIEVLPQARQELRKPRSSTLVWASRHRVPRRWILLTVLVAALYAVAGPAAQIASAVVPRGARTALSLSSYFNGLGTILMVLLVDPLTAHVVDEALRGERPVSDVTAVTVWQMGGRLAGVLLAQLLLTPAAGVFGVVVGYLVR